MNGSILDLVAEESLEPAEDGQTSRYDDHYLGIRELDSLPSPEPLIDGIIDDHCLMSIVGRGGTYKSFLAFDMLAHLATGLPFLGREVTRRKVLLVVGEGAYGLAQRRDAWEAANRVTISDEWFHVRRSPLNLFRAGRELQDLHERIRREQYGVILFDTLQRASAGADANSSRDAGLITEALSELRAITDGVVGFVAHTGKNAEFGTRGSSAWEDDLDIVWRLQCDKEANRVVATLGKRRDGEEGEELTFRPTVVPGTGSLVLEPFTNPLMHEPSGTREILAVLEGGAIPSSGLSASALQEAIGWHGKSQLYKGLSWLMNRGHVEKIEEGRWPSYRITVPGRTFLAEQAGDLR